MTGEIQSRWAVVAAFKFKSPNRTIRIDTSGRLQDGRFVSSSLR